MTTLSGRGNQTHFPITSGQIAELKHYGTIITIVSSLLLLPLFAANVYTKGRRSFPSRLTTIYMACALGLHVTVLVGLITHTTDFLNFLETHEVSYGCKLQGIFYQFFASATVWLWLLICAMLYCIIVKGITFRDLRSYERCTHFFWFGLAAAQTVVPFSLETAQPQIGGEYFFTICSTSRILILINLMRLSSS